VYVRVRLYGIGAGIALVRERKTGAKRTGSQPKDKTHAARAPLHVPVILLLRRVPVLILVPRCLRFQLVLVRRAAAILVPQRLEPLAALVEPFPAPERDFVLAQHTRTDSAQFADPAREVPEPDSRTRRGRQGRQDRDRARLLRREGERGGVPRVRETEQRCVGGLRRRRDEWEARSRRQGERVAGARVQAAEDRGRASRMERVRIR
jgi:hypothetical protein